MMYRFCIVLLLVSVSQGADFFESLLVRLECYPEVKQLGCNQTMLEKYPELKWSVSTLTLADTRFYMFTRNNTEVPELMHQCAGGLPSNTTFDPKCRTEIFLPGFVSGICNFAIYRELKNERLKCGCYNVILVDWMWGNIPDLVVASENMRIVAKQTVKVIQYLKETYKLTPDDFILTGHSYGAHLASYIANMEEVCCINGIEPSGILAYSAENAPLDGRLDASDAKKVNVLHTSAGQCLPRYFGVNYSCGHADFYYNGGKEQPEQWKHVLIAFLKQDWIYGLFSLWPAAYNHLHSLQYYKASMCPDGCQFIGIKCNNTKDFNDGSCGLNCSQDGVNCRVAGAYGCDCMNDNEIPKDYYLNTTDCCPYCDNSYLDTKGVTCGTTAPDPWNY